MELRESLNKELFGMFANFSHPQNYINFGGIIYSSDGNYNALIAEFMSKIRNIILETLRALKNKDYNTVKNKNNEFYKMYEAFRDYIREGKIDFKGELIGLKLKNLDTISFKEGELPRYRDYKTRQDKIIHIYSANVKKDFNQNEDTDVFVFIKIQDIVGKLNYQKAVDNLLNLQEGKYQLAKIIVRTYIVEKLLDKINLQPTNVDKEVKEYIEKLYKFSEQCLIELNKKTPEGGLKDTSETIEYVQDRIFPINIQLDLNENIAYIGKFGLSEKKDTLNETITKLKERINKKSNIALYLIDTIETQSKVKVEELLSYTRSKDKYDNKNRFLTNLGKFVRETIWEINGDGIEKFFLGYGDKKYEMSYGIYHIPSKNLNIRFLYEDDFFNDEKDKEKLKQAFIDVYRSSIDKKNKSESEGKIETEFFNLKDIFGEQLYGEIKKNILNPNVSEKDKDGVMALFFLITMVSLISLSYEKTQDYNKERDYEKKIVISFVFCLNNDNYQIWDVVRHMYKMLGIPVQTFTKDSMNKISGSRFTDASTKKNIAISLFKNTKIYESFIKKVDGSIPSDYLNIIFVVEENYLRLFTKRNTIENDLKISHSVFYIYNVKLAKKDDKTLNVNIKSDIPVPYLHHESGESLDILRKKINLMIEKEKKGKNVVAFITTTPDIYSEDIKDNLKQDFNDVFLTILKYFVLPVPNLKNIRNPEKGYIVDSNIISDTFIKKVGFNKIFQDLKETLGIKPIKAITKGEDFFQSSNLHLFGFPETIGYDIKEMFVYGLLGLSGYFSESAQYAYKSFDFNKKVGERYNVTRGGSGISYTYTISLYSIIPELLYQQQRILSKNLKKE